jgi:hypothetical protein
MATVPPNEAFGTCGDGFPTVVRNGFEAEVGHATGHCLSQRLGYTVDDVARVFVEPSYGRRHEGVRIIILGHAANFPR